MAHTNDQNTTGQNDYTQQRGEHHSHSNRGFAAMDSDRQREIASKGGQASSGNFAHNRERASQAGKRGAESRAESRNATNKTDQG